MTNSDPNPPGLPGLARKLAHTALATLQNRGELFLVELQEEKTRLIELFIWAAAVGFLGIMFLVVFTGTIIFLFPEGRRVYAAAGFCVFYLVAAVLALLNLKALWKRAALPFSDSMAEARKDREWLESSK